MKLSQPSRTTGAKSTRNACRCTASLSPSSSRETQEKARLDQSQAQFTSALAASRFSDREAFLAALLDDETAQRLTRVKTDAGAAASAGGRALRAGRPGNMRRTWRCVRKGWTLTSPPCKPSCTPWPSGCGDNTTRQGEIRQQLRQDAESRQQQQALGQQIAEAAQLADDWGYLNSLIGSSTGDRFRKFAQG